MPKRHRHRQSSHSSPAPEKSHDVSSPDSSADPKPEDLAALLLEQSRVRPVVVISRLADEDRPRLDGDSIALELKGVADVVVVTNGPFTYELEKLLPPDTHIFGSAARVYPPGLRWTADPYSSPLRLVRTPSDVATVTAQIIRDAEDLAFSGSWKTASPAGKGNSRETGLVKSIAPDGSRAVVELDNGQQLFLPAESTGLGVPLHWILSEGMTISGAFDTAKRVFSLAPIEAAIPGEGREDGDLVPALVRAVGVDSADLSLVPGHSHTMALSSISYNELDSVADLLTEGEVVAVRIHRNNGHIRLSMLDVDDSEPVLTAPELIPGGSPWLVPGRDLLPRVPEAPPGRLTPPSREVQNQSSVSGAAALKSVELALAAERAKRQQLEMELTGLRSANHRHEMHAAELDADVMLGRQQAAELAGLQQEADRLRRDLTAASKQLSDLRKKLRGVRREEATLERVFLDPEENFRFQLHSTWAVQVPAAEKPRLTMGPYRLGENFLKSLNEQPREKQKKALKAIVDLLANDPARLSAREAHPLRTSASGGADVLTRNNGKDACWRLYIEQNIAAARRLHYWKCADGVIELSSVTVHDGMQI
ncbi:hypothetical protein ACLKOZ_01395 [Arthrobacter sp. R4]|uniref:hypothetical protein n=1 Tax=Arthrobacter sp. R4 TaxID=644417 RepID=UPI003EDB4B30